MFEDLHLRLICRRIDIETHRGTELKRMIEIVADMIRCQRQAARK